MALTPITRKEQFLSRAAGDSGLELEPITREEHFLQAIIDSGGGSGGGSVTPASIVTATGQMTDAQAAETRRNLGAGSVNPPDVIDIISATPTITPAANTIYNCGELTSLTISNPPATGRYCIKFVSGATPTATVIPPKPAMKWQTDDNGPPQGFPAANTRYEINVDDAYVVLGEWPVPEVSA